MLQRRHWIPAVTGVKSDPVTLKLCLLGPVVRLLGFLRQILTVGRLALETSCLSQGCRLEHRAQLRYAILVYL